LFRGREKPRNSIPNHFSEEKNPWEFYPKPFLDEKNLGIPFRTIFGREKTSEFRSESFSEDKKIKNLQT
jgi:hypothetical protein